MIKLENVSTLNISMFAEKIDFDNGEILRALNKYNVKDYDELERLISSGDKDYSIDFFKNLLELIKSNIEYANKNEIEPTLFKFEKALLSGVDSKELRLADRKTLCKSLVLKNPITGSMENFEKIKNLRVFDLKLLLGKVVAYNLPTTGGNAFLSVYPTFNIIDAKKIVDAINFYEEQIIRQSKVLHYPGLELFKLHKLQKERIVSEYILDIIEYFLYSAEEFVWGPFTKEQKTALLSAINKRKTPEDKMLIERMTYMISNYTTLSEIESGVKQKTLDRFIVR